MIEIIQDNPQVILTPIILDVYFYIRLGLIGMKYDDAMRKLDPKYDGYHSFKIGGIGMVIPNYLKKVDVLEIDHLAKRFNRNLTGLWMSTMFIILMIMIIKL